MGVGILFVIRVRYSGNDICIVLVGMGFYFIFFKLHMFYRKVVNF